MQSLLNQAPFENALSSTPAAETILDLYSLLETYYHASQTAVVMVPMIISVIEPGKEDYAYLIDNVRDMVLESWGEKPISKKSEAKGRKTNHQKDSAKPEDEVDIINRLIQDSQQLATGGAYLEAVASIDQALSLMDTLSQTTILFIDRAAIYNNKAFWLHAAQRYEDALQSIQLGLESHPAHAVSYHTQAEILEALHRYPEALESIEKAIELENTPDKQAYKQALLKRMNPPS
ncbi:MAG: tetratricopeptide repeat protein [Bacteroidia bacterium]|nr:tetratricopeptide repeat protein [Bacteroidia bacterium]